MGLIGSLTKKISDGVDAAGAAAAAAKASAEAGRLGDDSAQVIAKSSGEFRQLAEAGEDVSLSAGQARAGGKALVQLPLREGQTFRYGEGTSVMGIDNITGTAVVQRAEDGAATLEFRGAVDLPIAGTMTQTSRVHVHRIDADHLQLRLGGLGVDKPLVSKIEQSSAHELSFTPVGADAPLSVRSFDGGRLEVEFALGGKSSKLVLEPS